LKIKNDIFNGMEEEYKEKEIKEWRLDLNRLDP